MKTVETTLEGGLETLPQLAALLREDRSIESAEEIEARAKGVLRQALGRPVSGAAAHAVATFQQQVGLLLKYKSYAVKASSPLGYSVFLQNPGEGFSFQQHRSRKVEIFHVLATSPGAFAFLCSYEEWRRVYDEARFRAWLGGEAAAEYDRFRIAVEPGDVLVIDRLGVVHTVLGCTLEEFATASTDLVDRLHDQNEGRSIPAQFSRSSTLPRLADLPLPPVSRRVRTTPEGEIHREPLTPTALPGGRRLELGTLPGFSALRYTVHPGKTLTWTVAPDLAHSLFVLRGQGRLALRAEGEASFQPALPITAGDALLLAPGCTIEAAGEGAEALHLSIQEIAPDLALAP